VVADLPYAVVRRHAHDDPMPAWLEDDVGGHQRAALNCNLLEHAEAADDLKRRRVAVSVDAQGLPAAPSGHPPHECR
jgi:hypothetical protein